MVLCDLLAQVGIQRLLAAYKGCAIMAGVE
jgi:hypothetical protein